MLSKKSLVVHQLAVDEAEQRGYYRMLHNEKFSESEVSSYIYQDCIRQLEPGEHYLLIQDTTQLNFEWNRENIRDKCRLGVLGDNVSLGLFLHPSLLVSVSSRRSMGFLDIQVWGRERKEVKESKTLKRVRNLRRKIEEKESYRWISSIEMSKSRLPFSCKLTCICDREGDISELLERVPDADTYLLIRSRDNRLLAGGQKLYEYLDSLPVAGSYTIALRSDKRRQRIGRQARIEVKYARVDLSPKSLQGKTLPIYVVEAREEPSSVPAGRQAIHWRLLTTHVIENIEQAKQVIDFYKERWLIEQVFRLLKNKGLQIENSQLESGKALACLSMIGLHVVNRVLLLHEVSKTKQPVDMQQTFSEQELACLRACNVKYEGKTPKQKNPYPANSLQWAYWVLARMGGWKPHEKQAGVISLFRGLLYFKQVFEGWQLAHFVS